MKKERQYDFNRLENETRTSSSSKMKWDIPSRISRTQTQKDLMQREKISIERISKYVPVMYRQKALNHVITFYKQKNEELKNQELEGGVQSEMGPLELEANKDRIKFSISELPPRKTITRMAGSDLDGPFTSPSALYSKESLPTIANSVTIEHHHHSPTKPLPFNNTHKSSKALSVQENPTLSYRRAREAHGRLEISNMWYKRKMKIRKHRRLRRPRSALDEILGSPEARFQHRGRSAQPALIEAECIICSEDMTEIAKKAVLGGKGGVDGEAALWVCELADCGALFCITCVKSYIDHSENIICPACTRSWDTNKFEEQYSVYDNSSNQRKGK
ncbi:uncharacterized protein IL334_001146 [Kwoniella shivajii]|uniref:RING-type domain-containing protein n=1 Tax=Kwoniella shivajii TaxID=564305 RepID=A0ABZ1CS84_9TREE|nr:hypothetical protein IL334_001146 [Kwoniella shivajii]